MGFPFYHNEMRVTSHDLDLLAPLFAQHIKVICPCERVYFVGPSVSGDGLPTRWKAGVEVVRNGMQPVRDKGSDPTLYMPLWAGDDLFGVAVLIGAAPDILERSASALLESSKTISHGLQLVKLGAVDPLTQLGNGLVLQARVASCTDPQSENVLILFDLFAKAADASKFAGGVAAMGDCLQGLIGHLAFPCHLGHGVFGVYWEGATEEMAARMADQVLQWLKRDKLGRGAVGFAVCDGSEGDACFDHAWQALQVAQKRGPFGLCSYATLENRAAHPLYPPPVKSVRALGRLMKGVSQFGLVELQPDDAASVFSEDLLASLPGTAVATGGRNGYIFLPDMTERDVLSWSRSAQSVFAENNVRFSMGISVYPFAGFRKADIIGNCRKSLIHTAFFGPGTCTVFDGVSLNISGDVYYTEGDMVQAAKEYQQGLRLDPENVNLLNSMGVTMAQMARYAKAIPYFEKVLEVDPRDFMALCNLGFAHVALGNLDQAIIAFEEGLGCDETHFDPLFQLGKIYVEQGRHKDAVRVLEQAEQLGPAYIEDVSHGAVHRFLGEAYCHLKNYKKGMASLQRAIRYNSRDAQSLSLLGKLYAEGGEGVDIGLSLCQQAVEIDGESWANVLRLGQVLLRASRLDEASKVLAELLPMQNKDEAVLLFQAELAEARGEMTKACTLYQKVLKGKPKHKDVLRALKRVKKAVAKGK